MYQSTAQSRQVLLIDIEHGTILNAPPEATVSHRYIDSHPFAAVEGNRVIVGPDAVQVAGGAGGRDYMIYEIASSGVGQYHLVRAVG